MRIELKQLVCKNGLIAVIFTPLCRYVHSLIVVGQMALEFGIEILLMETEFLESVDGAFFCIAVEHFIESLWISALNTAVVCKMVYVHFFIVVKTELVDYRALLGIAVHTDVRVVARIPVVATDKSFYAEIAKALAASFVQSPKWIDVTVFANASSPAKRKISL